MARARLSYEDYLALRKVNDARLRRLEGAYAKIYAELLRLLRGLRGPDIEGIASGFPTKHYLGILGQIDKVFWDLEESSREEIRRIIDAEYRLGKSRGFFDLARRRGPDRIAFQFGALDRMRIDIATSRAQGFISRAVVGSGGDFRRAMDAVAGWAREETLKNVATGRGINISTREFVKKLEAEGISRFQSVSGRSQSLQKYARMVMRTETSTVNNDAYNFMAQENGFDLVRVSIHANPCEPICAAIQNSQELFSLTGKTPGFRPASVLPNGGPPFHPNCKHVWIVQTDID